MNESWAQARVPLLLSCGQGEERGLQRKDVLGAQPITGMGQSKKDRKK